MVCGVVLKKNKKVLIKNCNYDQSSSSSSSKIKKCGVIVVLLLLLKKKKIKSKLFREMKIRKKKGGVWQQLVVPPPFHLIFHLVLCAQLLEYLTILCCDFDSGWWVTAVCVGVSQPN